jgi:hypothetical protein
MAIERVARMRRICVCLGVAALFMFVTSAPLLEIKVNVGSQYIHVFCSGSCRSFSSADTNAHI